MKRCRNPDWDGKLNISTEGVDYSSEDFHNYGYDPTPYIVLEKLVQLDLLDDEDVVVDYGCGKGRISFFLNSQVGCKVIGIDHSEKLLEDANMNLKRYGNCENIIFIRSKAEDFCCDEANCFYFFNPFSTRIFSRVLRRIEESFLKNPREILIFFYYSAIEYKLYLPTEPRLELIKSLEFSADDIGSSELAKLDVFRFSPID